MLRDVFYYGVKPNVHPREKFAKDFDDARSQSTTVDFWIINEFCDYRDFDWDFDFEFLPDEDVWAEDHINVWPSQHQKDSGTWLCNTDNNEPLIIYRADVTVINRKNVKTDNWVLLDSIDEANFDFSWHPDPTDPPYIYKWGCKFFPVELKPIVEYHVPGASTIKYMNTIVELAIETEKWTEFYPVDKNKFDLSWRPNPMDPPYIYVWGNKYVSAETAPTIEYHATGATEKKFMSERLALVACMDNWELFETIDKSKFDFSWIPDPTSPPYMYVWGNQWNKPEDKISIQYTVSGATEYKFMQERTTRVKRDHNWEIPTDIDDTSFDYSWEPSPAEPPFIYQFGTQWQKTGGPRYVVDGAVEVKYVSDIKAIARSNLTLTNWQLPDNIEIAEFDYSWHPDATENIPYIYVFGTQWALSGGPKYIMPGATVIKYIETPIAIAAPNRENWIVPDDIDAESFDFSWHPYAEDDPYIYQFGTQWQANGGPRYIAPGCDDMSAIKYIDTRVLKAKKLPNFTNWEIPKNIDIESFDFSWTPGVEDKPYIYEFGTQWQKTGGPRYVMPGAIDVKFVDVQKAKALSDKTNWVIPNGIDVSTFDFSWHPDSTSPKYAYQFGTIIDPNDGPRYLVPGNDGEMINIERVETVSVDLVCSQYFIETTLEELINKHPTELFWALNPDLDYADFDFNWRPSIEQANYVHAFGSEDNINTQTYFVNAVLYNKGFTELNYIEDKMEVKTKIDMFFVDKGNSESARRFEELKQQFPTIQKTRYLNTWVDTINRCINRSTTKLCWILNSELDYTDFDFSYYPNPWQMKMIHVFGTQWSHWGTTFMINRENFAEETKYVKIIEHLSCLNFVKTRRAKATNVLYDIVYIDHGNFGITTGVNVVKYEESYLKTFKNMLATLPNKKEHYIWVCSSVCDYNGFDFTYICDPFAREQLHVFPSDKQKFGDTFLVNVNKLRELIADTEKLEDIKINYNQHQRAKRLPAPTIITEGDSHVSTIHSDFDWPYATFVAQDNKDIQVIETEPLNLWSPETKTIQITSTGGTRITVPKEAKDYVKRELYDYPYISTASRLAKSTPMDIVFLSNGEVGADENYEHLLRTTHGLANRVTRVDGVNGRVAAYHAAAEASNSPWMFTVFAKLKVSNKFDWNWQPDRLQIPKHYVFHAKNPVNGLVYGHQAMIAYNKKLTLANTGKGLDFTMDDEHEVVELLSGTANFNTDAWSTWRTAFREALKLRANTDEASKNRLEFWLTVGSGKFSQYSIDGALNAVQYYEEVNGDFDKLKLSYEWEWLRTLFERYHK